MFVLFYFKKKGRQNAERKLEMKKKNNVSTMDFFIAWVLSLANDIRELVLVLRALYVYNKDYWYKVPACWVMACVHGVIIAITPQMKWVHGADIEMLGHHYSANFMMIGIWLIFSACTLYILEGETEAEEEMRIKRTSFFLRRHGIKARRTARK